MRYLGSIIVAGATLGAIVAYAVTGEARYLGVTAIGALAVLRFELLRRLIRGDGIAPAIVILASAGATIVLVVPMADSSRVALIASGIVVAMSTLALVAHSKSLRRTSDNS